MMPTMMPTTWPWIQKVFPYYVSICFHRFGRKILNNNHGTYLGECAVAGVQDVQNQVANEIPSKFALLKYVLECALGVGCCMTPVKTIGGSQQNDTLVLAHACAFCGVGMVFA